MNREPAKNPAAWRRSKQDLCAANQPCSPIGQGTAIGCVAPLATMDAQTSAAI